MSSWYNPYKKGPDWSQGLNDIVGKLMQMMMMKQLFGQGNQIQPPQDPMGQMTGPPQTGLSPMQGGPPPPQNPMQGGMPQTGLSPMGGQGGPPPIGVGPPGMAQAGMGQQMTQQLMMALQNNPQLLQMLMMMLNPGGAGGMMGPRRF